ncbi:MAG TPA: hypothetical protein VHM26_18255, partial [Chitinophagaceae bacterium]|nr:hypothetical protein [Chitinophagaceae bacterium]
MIVVRSLLTACLLGLLTFTNLFAQQPRAVQLFTASEDISMFLRPGEMFMDKEGLVWFGSDNKLVSFNGYHYTAYPLPENFRTYTDHARVSFHYQDRSGKYWTFINNNGLYQFDPTNATFKNISLPATTLAVLDSNRIIGKFLFEDSHDRLWFCLSEKGLISISNNQLRFYPIRDTDAYDFFVSATWSNKAYET